MPSPAPSPERPDTASPPPNSPDPPSGTAINSASSPSSAASPDKTDNPPTQSSSSSSSSLPPSPFAHLSLSPSTPLHFAQRTVCPGSCGKRRRYYCSDCLVPLVSSPTVSLPVHIDILQAAAEVPQRSTAQHVPLLAPASATVWRPFPECAARFESEVLANADPLSIAVLYPGENAIPPAEAVNVLPALRRVIVIDASWPKSVLLMRSPLLASLPRVTLPACSARSQFWRYAPIRGHESALFSPDGVGALTSTVESVHRFCDAYGKAQGQPQGFCDDLLWLFCFLHGRVKEVYEKAPGKRERILRKSKGLLNHL